MRPVYLIMPLLMIQTFFALPVFASGGSKTTNYVLDDAKKPNLFTISVHLSWDSDHWTEGENHTVGFTIEALNLNSALTNLTIGVCSIFVGTFNHPFPTVEYQPYGASSLGGCAANLVKMVNTVLQVDSLFSVVYNLKLVRASVATNPYPLYYAITLTVFYYFSGVQCYLVCGGNMHVSNDGSSAAGATIAIEDPVWITFASTSPFTLTNIAIVAVGIGVVGAIIYVVRRQRKNVTSIRGPSSDARPT